jgi:hypothetical protein
MATELVKLALFNGTDPVSGQKYYTAPNGVIVTSTTPISNTNYGLENLFDGVVSVSQQADSGHSWMDNGSAGTIYLVFDFGPVYDKYNAIKTVKVAPRYGNDSMSSSYVIQVSDNNSDWDEVVNIVTNDPATTPWGTVKIHDVNIPQRYVRFVLTKEGSYAGLGEVEFWIEVEPQDTHYYVSAQNGSDLNDGATPQTAWATVTKAAQSVVCDLRGHTHIHIAPGIYREAVIFSRDGNSYDSQLIFEGDPNCIHFPGHPQGIVRITESDTSGAATDTTAVYFNNKIYIQVRKLYIDGCGNNFAIQGNTGIENQTVRDVTVSSPNGMMYVAAYNSVSYSGSQGFSSCTCYNCIAYGGSGFHNCNSTHCMAFGCSVGFDLNAVHTTTNCIAYACATGFYISGGTSIITFYNCLASNCNSGYSSYTVSYRINAATCKYSNCIEPVINYTGTPPGLASMYVADTVVRQIVIDGARNMGRAVSLTTDYSGGPRTLNSDPDVGPWELPLYSMEWTDVKYHAPAIRMSGAGQFSWKFPVEAGKPVVKSVWIKQKISPRDVIPAMTSPTAPSGTVASKSVYDLSTNNWKAFDNNIATTWLTSNGDVLPQWLSYRFANKMKVAKYQLVSPNFDTYLSNMPKDWILEARNNSDEEWVLLDTQTGVNGWNTSTAKTFTLANDVGYKEFRITITAVQEESANQVAIGELKLLGWPESEETNYVKPSIIARGLDFYMERPANNGLNVWGQVAVYMIPTTSGVMELVAYTKAASTGAYSIFSDPV